MWETIRGYLTFTRKERFGVLFLLILITAVFVLPYFFKPVPGDPVPAAYQKMKEEIRLLDSRQGDSSYESVAHDRYHDQKKSASRQNDMSSGISYPAEMFYFDPNILGAGDWHRLGLPERLTQTILHYVDKGGRFHKAEDLKKIYGLRAVDYERLRPFVRIAKGHKDFYSGSGFQAKKVYPTITINNSDSFFYKNLRNTGSGFVLTGKKLEITDINNADSADWSRLPGIGDKLASRIVHFREKLGGFFAVDQVGETFGLPDSGFQKIKPCLRLGTVSLKQIDLNAAAREILQAHPYIRWQLAKIIINYRQQHGAFRSVDELEQLAQMDPAKFEKLKPYLVVNQ
jgi:competence protein ComEA